ncbi:MAG TPA: UDP-N-acetylglucosamine 2-epimerase (non-hydrolyzing) [Candidatus Saccharimonadales bacterium]|nr:UDP-N-acetylglucosamine 2-epimerase (non-hydrolyzing) [Candidatus Saccharimonadales bacterium]
MGGVGGEILLVAGARPNFMKVAPLLAALRRRGRLPTALVHTGQHYDPGMSDVFFQELGLPRPDVHLGVGSDTHARQTAKIMIEFETVVLERAPRAVLVVGDVNSTVACALVCAKLAVRVGHVEAGLRSYDRSMPEEVNRVLTDQLSEWLFTSCEDAAPNLLREGIAPEKIHFVGNVMIDTLRQHLPRADRSGVLKRLGVSPGGYALLTLHRPSNVDDPAVLAEFLGALGRLPGQLAVLFPVHPRTRARLEALAAPLPPALRLLEPLGYLEFLKLLKEARVVLTDSGGIQEETTVLGVPCLTLRENTERPVTVSEGTNVLVGGDPGRLAQEYGRVLDGHAKRGRVPKLWDGQASERIAELLERLA